uniref:PHD-type domain-containing protein n=1 Tax=Macrostomum lignano TaxID=282301 RepID=A0A1I8FCT7_9PLAT
VQLAMQTYEMVDRHIRRLDTDLARFEAELKERANRAAKGGGAAGVGASGGGGGADAVDGGDDGAGEPSGARRGRKRRQRADADNGADAASGRKSIKLEAGTAASTADDAASQLPPSGLPITAALTLTLTNNPAEVLDMPVDPNEPTYCICHQVSYGDMIGCDNVDCPIEWFHFNCVGLSTKPKGKWFCPKCQDARKHKKCALVSLTHSVLLVSDSQAFTCRLHFLTARRTTGAATWWPMHGFQPQTSAPPYELTFSPDRYSPGQTVQVTLRGTSGQSFLGFALAARRVSDDTEELVGGFEVPTGAVGGFWYSQNASLPNCLTHGGLPQSEITARWTAPPRSCADRVQSSEDPPLPATDDWRVVPNPLEGACAPKFSAACGLRPCAIPRTARFLVKFLYLEAEKPPAAVVLHAVGKLRVFGWLSDDDKMTPMQNKYIELLDTGRIRCDFTLPWTVNISTYLNPRQSSEPLCASQL